MVPTNEQRWNPVTAAVKIALISSSTSSNSLGRTLSLAMTASVISETSVYAFDDGPIWVGAKQFPDKVNVVGMTDVNKLANELAHSPSTMIWASKAVHPIPKVLSQIRSLAPDKIIVVDFDDDDVSIMEEYRSQSIKKAISIHPWHRLNPRRIHASQAAALQVASGVTYSSDYLKQTFVERFDNASCLKSVRIPHTRPPYTGPRSRDGLSTSNPVTVGFFGTVRPHKGLETLLRIARNPSFEVAVFEGQIPATQLTQSFKLYKPNTPLHRLYREIDLLVVPSDGQKRSTLNQLPAKIIDALAVGCPIAATPTPPINEYLIDGYLKVDDWSDPARLRHRLGSQTLSQLSLQSTSTYDQYFSPNATSLSLTELLSRLASSKSNGRVQE